MWSVVERTALAEAEIEYADYESDTIWVKFPIHSGNGAFGDRGFRGPQRLGGDLDHDAVDHPGQPRHLLFRENSPTASMRSPGRAEGNWAAVGRKIRAGRQAGGRHLRQGQGRGFIRLSDVDPGKIVSCVHPLRGLGGGYQFEVPLLEGEHVTDDRRHRASSTPHRATASTTSRFWLKSTRKLLSLGIDPALPYTVDDAGFFTAEAPGFEGGPRARRFRQEGATPTSVSSPRWPSAA